MTWPAILELVAVFAGSAYSLSQALDVGRFFVGVVTGLWLLFMSSQLAFANVGGVAVSNLAVFAPGGFGGSLENVHLSLPFLFCGFGMIAITILRAK